MIFVDTSAWYALVIDKDPHHPAAIEWIAQNTDPLITTDFIVDETLTLLKVRGAARCALALGETFFGEAISELHYLTSEEVLDAWRDFRSHPDKGWSFTDVTSKVMMERRAIRSAFAFDRHFRQFGEIEVVPNQ